MFSTLGIIPSEFWYIWFFLAHFTFGTPVGTVSVSVVVLLDKKFEDVQNDVQTVQESIMQTRELANKTKRQSKKEQHSHLRTLVR